MIKKLKIKFIALSMTALIVLLAMIVTGMNVISRNAVISEADATLSILSENRGRFPDVNGSKNSDDKKSDSANHDFDNPDKPKKEPIPNGMSPELPFESRYFWVLLNQSGELVMTATDKIASVDSKSAVDYAQKAADMKKSKGFVEHYRFAVCNDGDNTRYIFLDCERRLDNLRTFLFSSVIMSLAGAALVFAVICILSGKIIKPIAQSYEKQKRFITDAGHEIKTPLTVINANADILEMELGENESVSDIRQQAARLKSLTDDLIQLARMDEAENKLQKIDFPISEIIEDTARPFFNVAAQQQKHFSCNIEPTLTINGNSRAIQKLAEILLDNAFKYSPEGSTVSLSLERQNKSVRLSVCNIAVMPISEENLTHIFDRFYRTDESRNSETGGHGIGLSVAKSVVNAHGGKIHAAMVGDNTFKITAVLPI